MQRGGEGVGAGDLEGGEDGVAGLAGGEGEHGVAGRGVAVDGDAGEALVGRGDEHGLQEAGSTAASVKT